MALRYFEGTVSAKGEKFDAEDAVLKLRKAMKGLGTNEKVIIEILSSHCNFELQLIKDQYKSTFGRTLGKDFQKELSGHFEKLCLYLLLPRPHFRAYCLHQAVEGLGTDERTLVEILCTSSNREIEEIKDAYKERFKSNLEADIKGDTSGDFKHLLVGILQANRSEDPTLDKDLVERDVQDLHKAGIKKVGTDESVFTRILVCRSLPHLQAVFEAYLNKYQLSMIDVVKRETSGSLKKGYKTIGNSLPHLQAVFEAYLNKYQLSIFDVVKRETSGCLKKGYKTIVQYVMTPCEYFAKCFHKCLAGPGTNDERLIQLVVNHCEVEGKQGPGRPKMTWKKLTENDCRDWKLTTVDPQERSTWRSGVRSAIHAASQLPQRGPTDVDDAPIDLKDIANSYLQKYHVGLSKAIHDDTSGDYRKLLVRLTNIGY